MVDSKRVEKKLASLVVDMPYTTQVGRREYKRADRELSKFKRRNPQKFTVLISNLVANLVEFDREITLQTRREIDAFNKSFKVKEKRR